jgi:glycosyltransferase involved in cell wall biosynthesis
MLRAIDQQKDCLAPGPASETAELDARRTFSVTQISTTDERGGAARAAQRLHHGLASIGLESRMFVAQRFGGDADTLEYNPFAPAPAMFGRALFRLGRRWHRPSIAKAGAYFTPEWTFFGRRLISQLPACDVVNLHWVADLFDYRTLPQLTARMPVVWTFHDMNAFTGGCHYSGKCTRYVDRCGACPQLITSSGDGDMTRKIFMRKREILSRVSPGRLTIVCPSRWLAEEVQRSTLFRPFKVRVIPNGIDLDDYRPIERSEARRMLGLPAGARIVLFVADQIEDDRKGLRHLLQAFTAIRDIPGLLLVTLGRGDHELLPHSHSRHLGPLNDLDRLRAAYSAADVFAIPSLQDNLPNTILESMACGTPVVGFAAGGVGEAVIDGQTGLLAPTGDSTALAAALRRLLLDWPLQQALATEARLRVEQHFTVRLQAQRYAALYREILHADRPAQP